MFNVEIERRDVDPLPGQRHGIAKVVTLPLVLQLVVRHTPQMLALAPGQSMARAMVYQGRYCVVAITAGSGYREFKRSDGYREEVLALSVQAFGAVQDDALAAVGRRNTRVQSLAAASQNAQGALAAVQAGNQIAALQAQQLMRLQQIMAQSERAKSAYEAERSQKEAMNRELNRQAWGDGAVYMDE